MSASQVALGKEEQQEFLGESAEYENVKISIEGSTEGAQAYNGTVESEPATSKSSSASPPMEVMVVSEDDEDPYNGVQSNVTMMGEDIPFDPAMDFPFPRDYLESWYELFARSLPYMVTSTFSESVN